MTIPTRLTAICSSYGNEQCPTSRKKAGSHKSLQHKADPYDEYPFCSLFTIFKFFGVFFWPFASVLRDLMGQELKEFGITIFRPCCADGRTFTGSKMTMRLLSCEQRMYSAVTSYLVTRAIVREDGEVEAMRRVGFDASVGDILEAASLQDARAVGTEAAVGAMFGHNGFWLGHMEGLPGLVTGAAHPRRHLKGAIRAALGIMVIGILALKKGRSTEFSCPPPRN
jgi:hypothetical protein